MAIGRDIYDAFPRYPFVPPPELSGEGATAPVTPVPVAIVGGGPIGLPLALGLACHGVRSVVLEPRDSASFGSRAPCTSRRSLEIWERFGAAEAALAMGLAWTGGSSFWHDHTVFSLAMHDDADQKHPPMINIQQCFAEQFLIDAVAAAPGNRCPLVQHGDRCPPGRRRHGGHGTVRRGHL